MKITLGYVQSFNSSANSTKIYCKMFQMIVGLSAQFARVWLWWNHSFNNM